MPKVYHKVEKIVFPTSSHLNLKETNYGGNLSRDLMTKKLTYQIVWKGKLKVAHIDCSLTFVRYLCLTEKFLHISNIL